MYSAGATFYLDAKIRNKLHITAGFLFNIYRQGKILRKFKEGTPMAIKIKMYLCKRNKTSTHYGNNKKISGRNTDF